MTCRHLIVVLGDQLDDKSAAFDGFDPAHDVILQMEVREEATYIPQHKLRIAFFFSAMRHFRDAQRALGRRVLYREVDDPANQQTLWDEINRAAVELQPRRIVLLEPGEWRIRQQLAELEWPHEFRADRHFLITVDEFQGYTHDHAHLVLETFYRWMRRHLQVLMKPDGSPVGGQWNFDHHNRDPFRGARVPDLPPPPRFPLDALSNEVIALVKREFAGSPGSCDRFGFAVTRRQARSALGDFVTNRLSSFGRYQDAMRHGEPFLFHSQLSGLLNLHLLNPREVLDTVLAAKAPLNSVEGFVRQVIGWREYVRGIYWHNMPGYAQQNQLGAELPIPRFFWTGDTDLSCLADAIQHTLEHAYAHHIERLMVLGLFFLLLGVRPYDVHRWHLSMFWDAIDWVSLPNVIGMSQHADGGLMATKPYVASGHYINRMSDHCRRCRYDPKKAVGEDACPFTTLYWDFLARHTEVFKDNPRMNYSYKNLRRKTAEQVHAIQRQADFLKAKFTAETFL